MKYIQTADGLREPLITNSTNPEPLFTSKIMLDIQVFPEYKPTEPGVYSCILEINDQANNSEYVRRIVIYDDTSEVSVNTSQRLLASSATPDTNFLWQINYYVNEITNIEISWQDLFTNSLHHEEHYLSKVLNYESRLSDNVRRHNYKRILTIFDDSEGDRTTNSIPNINGIVKFQLNHKTVSALNSELPTVGWIDLLPLALNTSFAIAANTIKDGDSHQIWIRALDVMGHSKTVTTIVHFDGSGPEIYHPDVAYDVNGKYKFTSR